MSVNPEKPNDPLYIARVMSMWEESGGKFFHALWFSHGSETILGDTSDPRELFLVDSCDDMSLTAITGRVHVQLDEMEGDFFVRKWYDPDRARFEDPPVTVPDQECRSCVSNQQKVRKSLKNVRIELIMFLLYLSLLLVLESLSWCVTSILIMAALNMTGRRTHLVTLCMYLLIHTSSQSSHLNPHHQRFHEMLLTHQFIQSCIESLSISREVMMMFPNHFKLVS